MSFGHLIREIGRGPQGARDLSYEEARQLYGAMLDGGVPELELGAITIAMRIKGESVTEMSGFLSATNDRLYALRRPAGRLRPILFLRITVRAKVSIWFRCCSCYYDVSEFRYLFTA